MADITLSTVNVKDAAEGTVPLQTYTDPNHSDRKGPVTAVVLQDGTLLGSADLPVSAESLPLPAGAATSANQGTANASLASLDGKAPPLGQALAAASVPVVLPAAQITSLTAPSVGGNVANDAVDSGNPVKVGGKANNSTPALVANGDRVDAWCGSSGQQVVAILGPLIAVPGDGADQLGYLNAASAGNGGVPAVYLYNGSRMDRQRNNHEVTVLPSSSRTAGSNSSDQVNYNARGLKLVIDVTAVSGSPSLTFTVKGKSSLSGKYFTILASAAVTGTGTTVLTVFPGATAAANLTANDLVPRLWRLEVSAGTADSVTYSVDAQFIV